MRTAAIIPAAGQGERLGADRPKALVELHDEALVAWAARNLVESNVVDLLVVAAPEGFVEDIREAVARRNVSGSVPVIVVEGGATRQASVSAALAVLPDDVDTVLVHDAARCLTPPDMIRRVAQAVTEATPAVVPGVPVVDTLKRTMGPGDVRVVRETVSREELFRVQTPQGFRRDLLEEIHSASANSADGAAPIPTDDASMVEASGRRVHLVKGDDMAFKITTWLDLWLAQAILSQ